MPVITLDGPTASGKGTVAAQVAKRLGFHVLDSGLLYRVLALAARHHGVADTNEPALQVLAAHLDVQFPCDHAGETRVTLEGEEVSRTLREEWVGMAASRVAVLPGVRVALLNRQRAFQELPGLVADGRDMGTIVFPEADLKIYITATADARAERRYRQLLEKGFSASLADLTEDIRQRDERDMQRSVAPLRAAADSVHIDTTLMNIPEVVDTVLSHVRQHVLLSRFLSTGSW